MHLKIPLELQSYNHHSFFFFFFNSYSNFLLKTKVTHLTKHSKLCTISKTQCMQGVVLCNWYLGTVTNSRLFLVAQMVRDCLQFRRPGFDPWVKKTPWGKGNCYPYQGFSSVWPHCMADANQTKTSEFGAEKGILQGQERRWVTNCPISPQTPQRVSGKHFKGQVS